MVIIWSTLVATAVTLTMSRRRNEVIKYDVDIDKKILNTVNTNESANFGQLRENAISNINLLNHHIENLERWGLIQDIKSPRNGIARKVTLKVPYDIAMTKINKLKDAVDTVNDFFIFSEYED